MKMTAASRFSVDENVGSLSLLRQGTVLAFGDVALTAARSQSLPLAPKPHDPEVSITTDENGQIFAEWQGVPGCRDILESGSDLQTWTPVQSTYSFGQDFRVHLGQIDPSAPLPPGATDWSAWTFLFYSYNLKFVWSPTSEPFLLATWPDADIGGQFSVLLDASGFENLIVPPLFMQNFDDATALESFHISFFAFQSGFQSTDSTEWAANYAPFEPANLPQPVSGANQARITAWNRWKSEIISIIAANPGSTGSPTTIGSGGGPGARKFIRVTRELDLDSDGDGLTDWWELWFFIHYTGSYSLNPFAANSDGFGAADGDLDWDMDGLTNAQEFALGTNAVNADTDGDGVNDGDEVARGKDPTNSASFPPVLRYVERYLSYNHSDEDENYEPPTPAYTNLYDDESWNGTFSYEELDPETTIPYTQIPALLANALPFPAATPAQWLTYQGNASETLAFYGNHWTLPDPTCNHANLKHARLWLQRDAASDAGENKVYLKITERTVGEISQEPEVEVVEIEIPSMGTISPPVDVITSFTSDTGDEHVTVNLLPVDIREAWSDQIADVEANGMPNKTGNANKSYMLMGVRTDGKAHGKLRLGTAIPDGLRSKILWRFQKKSGGAPETGSSTYEQDGLIVRMSMDSAANADDKDYIAVVGFDANGDGSLTTSEVSMTPTTKHDPPGGGVDPTEMPFTFTAISSDRYEQSRTENLNAAGHGAVQLATPNAAELLTAFCNGGNAPNASNVSPVSIERDHPGLTHPVGIAFTPTAQAGQSVRFEFNGATDFAKDFTKTDRFRDALLDELRKSEWINQIANHYLDDQGNPINPLDEDVWFSWTWEAITGVDNLDFRGAISSPMDLDMWVALGKVKISGTVSVKANWLNQDVSEMRFTGTVEDVYDFDYDDNGIAIGNVQIRPKLTAEVQSGHPTLTPGGRVFLTRLNYDNANLNLTYRFYGL